MSQGSQKPVSGAKHGLQTESGSESVSGHEYAHYANYWEAGFNASEVVLDIGQFYADEARPRLHTRIVTTPVHLRSLIDLLQHTLSQIDSAAATSSRRQDS